MPKAPGIEKKASSPRAGKGRARKQAPDQTDAQEKDGQKKAARKRAASQAEHTPKAPNREGRAAPPQSKSPPSGDAAEATSPPAAERSARAKTQELAPVPAPPPVETITVPMGPLSRLFFGKRSIQVDDFGMDQHTRERWEPFFEALYYQYFRAVTEGTEHIPERGRAVLVANHTGPLPWDAAMLQVAVRLHSPAGRLVRPLFEDLLYHLPFLGPFATRLGAVRACPENAERLLAREELIAVFPEGVKGLGKLFRESYQLQRFGRGGYVKLCLRSRAPLIPVAIVGAAETQPLLYKTTRLSRSFGLPFLALSPPFPLPARWRIRFLPPIPLEGYQPQDAEDALLVHQISDQVRNQIQEAVDDLLEKRGHPFWEGRR